MPSDKMFSKSMTWAHRRQMEEVRLWLYNYDNDPNIDDRKIEQSCKHCFYHPPRIALQAFTDSSCKGCAEVMTFCNSITDRYCHDCASRHSLCKHCGAEMD